MLDSLHFIRKSSFIAQKKRIIMEKKVPSSQIFLLSLILSISWKTFFLRHFYDVIKIKPSISQDWLNEKYKNLTEEFN